MRRLWQVAVIIVFAAVASASVANASGPNSCDSAFVKRDGHRITVLPNGHDDTANLQCALDMAVSLHNHAIVRLVTGDYYTAQVNVYGFEGRLSGDSMQTTVIHNVPWPIPVTPVDYFAAWPSAEWQWSGLLIFVGGRFTVSDLSLKISGFPVTTGTTFSFWDLEPFSELQFGILATGNDTHARLVRVAVDAELAPLRSDDDPGASLYGTNVINAIMLGGLLNYEPISGSLIVKDSRTSKAGSGIILGSVHDASAVVSGNEVTSTSDGIDLWTGNGGIDYFVHGNQVTAPYALLFMDWGDPQPPIFNSRLRIADNKLAGSVGIDMAGAAYAGTWTFGADVECRMVNNDVDGVTGPGILLGPGTTGCVVVGTPADRIVDEGTDNVIIPKR